MLAEISVAWKTHHVNTEAKTLGIVGLGGFAKEIAWYILESNINISEINKSIQVHYISAEKTDEIFFEGFEVIAETDFLVSLSNPRSHFITVADPRIRSSIDAKYTKAGSLPQSIVSKNSRIANSAIVGAGSAVCPGVMIMPNVKIGSSFHANINSYVAHDCVIGNYVTFSPGVMCNGNVIIEDNVFVGTGAIIRNGTRNNPIVIGQNSVIGMGAVVTKNVNPGETVVGMPAKKF